MNSKSSKKVVLVWDSGVGGLSILNALIVAKTGVKYVYYADTKNLPYGTKSVLYLRQKVLPNMDKIIKQYNPVCIILACNTITATLVDEIRSIYKNIFVIGTEPAIKPALRSNKEMLLMMTPVTYDNCKLVRELKEDKVIKKHWLVDENLAMVIQDYWWDKKYIKEYITTKLIKYKDKKLVVVLGCTHYVLVKDIIMEILGGNAEILDSTQGVTNRLKQVLKIEDERDAEVEIVGSENIKSIWYSIRGNDVCVE